MSINKIKRIMWRLREKNTTAYYLLKEVRRAIIFEVGCDERTITKYIKLLKETELLKRNDRYHFVDIAGVI